MKPPAVLDLFSGIGGFSLGLERAGMRTVAFCEIEPYCRRVLRKHWPTVPIFEDVRTITSKRLVKEGVHVDAICGGFPCQDISNAGRQKGIDGERSGLWREYARIIREIRPRFAIVENVAALRTRGLDRVLGDLAAIGYDAEWHCVPASYVGAVHQRDRIWIVAYPNGHGYGKCCAMSSPATDVGDDKQPLDAAHRSGLWALGEAEIQAAGRAYAASLLCGKSDGIPHRVDRLRALGNAVVPQVAELIGRMVLGSTLASEGDS